VLAISALAQAGVGAYQALTSGRGAAERDFESFAKKRPLAKASPTLENYYQKTLSAANENPYQSAQYMIARQEADRRLASGLGALQQRGGAISGISKLDLMRTDAQNQAIRNAESLRGQNLNRLGQSTQMKTAQDRYLYDVNEATPFNTMLGIKQMKSQAANERYNAGLQMISGAASNAAMGAMSGGFDKAVKVTPSSSGLNLNSYNTLKNSPFEFGTNYIDYNSQSANPSAFGTNYMDFNKYKNTFFSYLHQTINRSKNKSILPLSSPIAMNISLGYYDKHYSMISVHWYLSNKDVLSKLHKNLEVFSYKVKYAKNDRTRFGYQHSL